MNVWENKLETLSDGSSLSKETQFNPLLFHSIWREGIIVPSHMCTVSNTEMRGGPTRRCPKGAQSLGLATARGLLLLSNDRLQLMADLPG
jgi:hypothetical protein